MFKLYSAAICSLCFIAICFGFVVCDARPANALLVCGSSVVPCDFNSSPDEHFDFSPNQIEYFTLEGSGDLFILLGDSSYKFNVDVTGPLTANFKVYSPGSEFIFEAPSNVVWDISAQLVSASDPPASFDFQPFIDPNPDNAPSLSQTPLPSSWMAMMTGILIIGLFGGASNERRASFDAA